MARSLTLTLALVTAILAASGCISEPVTTDVSDEPADVKQVEAPAVGCKSFRMNVNYGVSLWLGGTAYSYHDGDDQRTYIDDNGISGLQTEETCPTNPDTRVA